MNQAEDGDEVDEGCPSRGWCRDQHSQPRLPRRPSQIPPKHTPTLSRRPSLCHLPLRPHRARRSPPPSYCSPTPISLSWLASPAMPQHSRPLSNARTTRRGAPNPRPFSLVARPRPTQTPTQRRRKGQSQARLFRSHRLPLVRAMADLPVQMSSSRSPRTPGPAQTSTLSSSIS